MKVILGSDHAGFRLKELLKPALLQAGHEVEDLGVHSEESVDYPDYAVAVARRVVAERQSDPETGRETFGVLICGTGIGVCIAANKIRGVRAARCDEPYSARMTRAHNDANVLCLGERVIGPGLAAETVLAFLAASFEGGRHERRVRKIEALEREP